LGLLRATPGVASHILQVLGLNLDEACHKLEEAASFARSDSVGKDQPLTPDVKEIIDRSIDEARLLRHNYVGTEHLLLGILRVPGTAAAKVLTDAGMTLEQVRTTILEVL